MSELSYNSVWVLAESDDAYLTLASELSISTLLARALVARGIKTSDEARVFLSPSLRRDLHDPLSIPGMQDVVARLITALDQHEKILVFGDFDVDGMTSCAILTLALRHLGGDVTPFVPHRFGEGYGLSPEALRRAQSLSAFDLLVTVDNGISAAHEVSWLLSQKIDVCVTDHHEPGDLVPKNVPICDPKLSDACPSRDLCGAGVALKIVQLLGANYKEQDLYRAFTDLAALGTIADLMYLGQENRAIVADGLKLMRSYPRAGISALCTYANVELQELSADKLPYSLIPRLNAAGRMGNEDAALELLLCEDPARAQVLAASLEKLNGDRKKIESEISELAIAQAAKYCDGDPIILVGGEGWHEGVKGIVAARLVSHFKVPAIVFSYENGIAKGSGRSVGSFDFFSALEYCADLLERFGGHPGAVGLTCKVDHIEQLRARLFQYMEANDVSLVSEHKEICAVVSLSELTVQSISELDRLQPIGQGNPTPLFALLDVRLMRKARVGAEGIHARFSVTDNKTALSAIMFRCPNVDQVMTHNDNADIIFEAVNETWKGYTKPKLMVKDILLKDRVTEGPGSDVKSIHADLPAILQGCDRYKTDQKSGSLLSGIKVRMELIGLDYRELTNKLVSHFIGDNPLLPAQSVALDILARGQSCLAIMATGRGKSLIFQIHAARQAIYYGYTSIVVYPLRALINDQLFHFKELYKELGITAEVLCGQTPERERSGIFTKLAERSLDVVLTTPEFLSIHKNAFAQCSSIRFLVIDEAHHIAEKGVGKRSAYEDLANVSKILGIESVLAVSATVDTTSAHRICDLFEINPAHVIKDLSSRDNLMLDDIRMTLGREQTLARIISAGEKTVVYVTTRQQASELTRELRHRLGYMADKIAFYHGGLSREKRYAVERAFRDDVISCIVSTSAFGEGVNISSIRHVVLFSLPFSRTEFNQMSGRAGRDGKSSIIHLLYQKADADQVKKILSASAPPRASLMRLYKVLMTIVPPGSPIALCDAEIAEVMSERFGMEPLREEEISSGILVFEELGFCSSQGYGTNRMVTMCQNPHFRNLEESSLYSESMASRQDFENFFMWVFCSDASELISTIRYPIVPEFGIVVDSERS